MPSVEQVHQKCTKGTIISLNTFRDPWAAGREACVPAHVTAAQLTAPPQFFTGETAHQFVKRGLVLGVPACRMKHRNFFMGPICSYTECMTGRTVQTHLWLWAIAPKIIPSLPSGHVLSGLQRVPRTLAYPVPAVEFIQKNVWCRKCEQLSLFCLVLI